MRCELNEIALECGTDKATKHKYTFQYARYFEPLRHERLKLMEIGVKSGASMRLWERYFTRAEIVGVDIADCKEHETERVRIFRADQTDREALEAVVRQTGPLDIVIDDGDHHVEAQLAALGLLWRHVAPGGMYVIEDLASSYRPDFGGGYLRAGSMIEFLKGLVDVIHNEYVWKWNKKGIIGWPGLEGIHFYEQLVFLFKRA